MKKSLLILFAFLFVGFISCDRFHSEVFRSFVFAYTEIENVAFGEFENGDIAMFCGRKTICDWRSKGAKKKLYDSLCIAHNDISYNKEISYYIAPDDSGEDAISLPIHNVASIQVFSNADFDELHPAGTSLNDLIRFCSSTVYPFLQSNYTYRYTWTTDDCYYAPFFCSPINKLLSEIQPADLIMLYPYLGLLHFEKSPSLSKTHELTITIVLDNGKIVPIYSRDDVFNKCPTITKIFE